MQTNPPVYNRDGHADQQKSQCWIGPGRTGSYLLHQPIARLSTKPSTIPSSYLPCWSTDRQADIYQPARAPSSGSAALIGSHHRDWHAQLPVCGTLHGIGRPITAAPATQRAIACLLATNGHGDDGSHVAVLQVAQHCDRTEALVRKQALDRHTCLPHSAQQSRKDGACLDSRLDEDNCHSQTHIVEQKIGGGTAIEAGRTSACLTTTDPILRRVGVIASILRLVVEVNRQVLWALAQPVRKQRT
jgi:hypothetical protein